jgi:hypothetical protein
MSCSPSSYNYGFGKTYLLPNLFVVIVSAFANPSLLKKARIRIRSFFIKPSSLLFFTKKFNQIPQLLRMVVLKNAILVDIKGIRCYPLKNKKEVFYEKVCSNSLWAFDGRKGICGGGDSDKGEVSRVFQDEGNIHEIS